MNSVAMETSLYFTLSDVQISLLYPKTKQFEGWAIVRGHSENPMPGLWCWGACSLITWLKTVLFIVQIWYVSEMICEIYSCKLGYFLPHITWLVVLEFQYMEATVICGTPCYMHPYDWWFWRNTFSCCLLLECGLTKRNMSGNIFYYEI